MLPPMREPGDEADADRIGRVCHDDEDGGGCATQRAHANVKFLPVNAGNIRALRGLYG
jgi:hypothetical protein